MSKPTARALKPARSLPVRKRALVCYELLESRQMLSVTPVHRPVAHAVMATPMIVAATSSAVPATAGTTAGVATPEASPTPPAGSTSPAQMRRFYSADNINFGGVPGDGRGMTIALVDAYHYPNAQNDLHQFDTYYGLPDPPSFQVVNEFGNMDSVPSVDSSGSWGIEAALDVQWAHAMAPLANIVLMEVSSADPTTLFQAAAVAANMTNVVAVSMSFGVPDSGSDAFWDSNFLTPSGHGGVTFVAATGDGGTPGTYPAYSPNVVAVGGTRINFGTDGNYGSETAWTDTGSGHSTGGGVSTVEARPSWQNGFVTSLFRGTPDISMDADPATGVSIYDAYNLGAATPWAKFGGTSLGTPMFAGLIAIADQGRVSVGQSRLDGRTQTLPALYALASTDIHDVIGGTSTGGATAVAGYDLATGRGSPIANLMMNHLAGAASVVPSTSGTSGNDNFTLTLDPNQLYVDWSNGVTSGQTAVVDLNGLTLNGSGGNDTLTLNSINGNPLPNLLKLNGYFTLIGLSGNNPLAGKAIDLNRSTLYVTYSPGADPLTTIQQYLANGYNGSAWNGQPTSVSGGITSSPAAANASHNTSIGYVDSADGTGYNPMVNSIKLTYTLMGDSNLDGSVNATDYNDLVAHYKQPGTYVWDQGSFDYTGSVTFASFAMIAANYNQVVGSLAVPANSGGTSSGSTTIADAPALTPVTTTSTSTTSSVSGTATSSGTATGTTQSGLKPTPTPATTTPPAPGSGQTGRGKRSNSPVLRAANTLVSAITSCVSSNGWHGRGGRDN